MSEAALADLSVVEIDDDFFEQAGILSSIGDIDASSEDKNTGTTNISSTSKTAFKQSKGKAKDKRLLLLKVLVAALILFLCVEAVIWAFVLPCFASPTVMFQGLSEDEKAGAALMIQPLLVGSWAAFDVKKAADILSSKSYIESVSIVKHFPDKVSISVKTRTPVAKTILFENGASKSVQIDKNCVLFTSRSPLAAHDSSIPLISGLPAESLKEGMRLPAKYRALIEQISAIRALPQKYFAAISEIQVVPKEYGNYELVLFPTQAKIRVLTDRSLSEDRLKYMMVALDVVNSMEPNVVEVDLRYDSLSYRCR